MANFGIGPIPHIACWLPSFHHMLLIDFHYQWYRVWVIWVWLVCPISLFKHLACIVIPVLSSLLQKLSNGMAHTLSNSFNPTAILFKKTNSRSGHLYCHYCS